MTRDRTATPERVAAAVERGPAPTIGRVVHWRDEGDDCDEGCRAALVIGRTAEKVNLRVFSPDGEDEITYVGLVTDWHWPKIV